MTYKKDSVKKAISFRLTDDLRNKIDEKAKQECNSRNGLIKYAIKFYLRVTSKIPAKEIEFFIS